MKLTAHVFQTIDGVMQGPGGPDEDPSGGFTHGGWLVPYADAGFGAVVDGWFSRVDAFLLGRSTHDMMHAYWSLVTDPDDRVAAALNGLPKHVVSTSLTTSPWANTSIIGTEAEAGGVGTEAEAGGVGTEAEAGGVGTDVVTAVRALKERPGRELQVHGSWALLRTLHDAGLVDTYRLLTFPVVVGGGKRTFPDGALPSGFTVVEATTTASGLVHHVLEPAPLRSGGEFVVEDGREVVR